MKFYQYSHEQLQDVADTVKVSVLTALVTEKLIDELKADAWAANHTILFLEKTIWRTLTTLWKNEKETENHYVTVVKKV